MPFKPSPESFTYPAEHYPDQQGSGLSPHTEQLMLLEQNLDAAVEADVAAVQKRLRERLAYRRRPRFRAGFALIPGRKRTE